MADLAGDFADFKEVILSILELVGQLGPEVDESDLKNAQQQVKLMDKQLKEFRDKFLRVRQAIGFTRSVSGDAGDAVKLLKEGDEKPKAQLPGAFWKALDRTIDNVEASLLVNSDEGDFFLGSALALAQQASLSRAVAAALDGAGQFPDRDIELRRVADLMSDVRALEQSVAGKLQKIMQEIATT